MTIIEQNRAREILRAVAAKNGVSAAEVRQSIQEAIDAAWDNPDPAAKARQQQLFPDGRTPTVEEFLIRVSRELNPWGEIWRRLPAGIRSLGPQPRPGQ